MIKPIYYGELGRAQHGWLDARHHFSFGNYYNPKRMSFGTLRVINDDIIAAGTGFGIHPHANMEIITYVRQGAITHKDSNGNEGRTEAGDVGTAISSRKSQITIGLTCWSLGTRVRHYLYTPMHVFTLVKLRLKPLLLSR